MTSFFRSIRGYFDAQYHGRYFSLLLLELARNERDAFSRIIEEIPSASNVWNRLSRESRLTDVVPQVEFQFSARKRKRRADLALIRGETPILLMEIKEFDHLNPSNPLQVDDYLYQAEKKGIALIYVSRFLPDESTYLKIQSARKRGAPVTLLTYHKIYSSLRREDSSRYPLSGLVCSYLEDIGVGIYQPVRFRREDGKAVKFLLVQLLGFPHQTGMRRIQSDASVRASPDLLKTLLGNIEAISEWLREPNAKIIPKQFTRRFWVYPKLDNKKYIRAVRKFGKAS